MAGVAAQYTDVPLGVIRLFPHVPAGLQIEAAFPVMRLGIDWWKLKIGLPNGFGPSVAVESAELCRYDRVSNKRYNRRPIDTPIGSSREAHFKETRCEHFPDEDPPGHGRF